MGSKMGEPGEAGVTSGVNATFFRSALEAEEVDADAEAEADLCFRFDLLGAGPAGAGAGASPQVVPMRRSREMGLDCSGRRFSKRGWVAGAGGETGSGLYL